MLELVWILLNLSSKRLDVVRFLLVLRADNVEHLSDHLEGVNLLDLINFTFEELTSHIFQFSDFFFGVIIVVDSSLVSQSIVHS